MHVAVINCVCEREQSEDLAELKDSISIVLSSILNNGETILFLFCFFQFYRLSFHEHSQK